MGANMSAQPPRISKDKAFIYYNIKDKDDKNFENGAKNILDNCNKMFNVDLAEKVYPQKATLEEYNQADPA